MRMTSATLLRIRFDGLDDSGQIDRRHIREFCDDRVLQSRRIGRRRHATNEHVKAGRVFQNARGKNDEEVCLKTFPIDFAQTRDFCFDRDALHIENQLVADLRAEIFRDIFVE